jgi:predicted TIM-barrel fold metal-dependent hydrolase
LTCSKQPRRATSSAATRVDVHQHIWTPPLLEALAARDSLPFVRVTDGVTVLHSAGERAYVIDVESEAPSRRTALLDGDGVDLALIAISSPIGIESLPRHMALELIAAQLDGVAALGERFARWGPIALDRPDPGDVDRLLARGCVGISLSAGALAGPDSLIAIGTVLERAQARRAAVFVHPGGAPGREQREAAPTEPLWWRALTDYVAQMQAAWLTFATLGRREFPELTILFPMLAGGAPLLTERLGARGGPDVELRDPLTFYDTSSYGPSAIEAMARRVGPDQLVYGSDRPLVEPVSSGREALLQSNGGRFAGRIGAPA